MSVTVTPAVRPHDQAGSEDRYRPSAFPSADLVTMPVDSYRIRSERHRDWNTCRPLDWLVAWFFSVGPGPLGELW
ncbi:hypothetical protein [Microbispora bryophytorum]|uniref:hypothetical protein n=1 Tax=Microbispora bryophytorum TaxID=1460882 RepID=UPI0034046D24